MKKIMFNDKYGLTRAVLECRKTQTRRLVPLRTFDISLAHADRSKAAIMESIKNNSTYKVGDEVAVAQAYKDIPSIADINYAGVDWDRASKNKPFGRWGCANKLPGWSNKMFVRADLMPHRIKITNIRVERLQDISEEDCLQEGIRTDGYKQQYYCASGFRYHYSTPREAFAVLIDKTCGKGTWESNPYVFVYDFELIR